MKKPSVAIKLKPTKYNALVQLSGRVCEAMSLNPAFANPMPALSVLQTSANAVSDAIAVWGQRGNRGSHVALLDLRDKALKLHELVNAEAKYVEIAAQLASGSDYTLMAHIISTSGFAIKGAGSPQGLLEPVQNLRRRLCASLSENKAKVKWNAPNGVTSLNNIKSYMVFRSETTEFSTAVQVAITSAGEYIVTNDTGSVVSWYFWIVPVSAAGVGAVSAPLLVRLLPI